MGSSLQKKRRESIEWKTVRSLWFVRDLDKAGVAIADSECDINFFCLLDRMQ